MTATADLDLVALMVAYPTMTEDELRRLLDIPPLPDRDDDADAHGLGW